MCTRAAGKHTKPARKNTFLCSICKSHGHMKFSTVHVFHDSIPLFYSCSFTVPLEIPIQLYREVCTLIIVDTF